MGLPTTRVGCARRAARGTAVALEPRGGEPGRADDAYARAGAATSPGMVVALPAGAMPSTAVALPPLARHPPPQMPARQADPQLQLVSRRSPAPRRRP
eukprot:12763583-Alexandrium_andersonii.AAC.1